MGKILVTGAAGQIGTELVERLCSRYGRENIIATDLKFPHVPECEHGQMDVTSRDSVDEFFREHSIDSVYHLAAVLSARGEENPGRAFDVNANGTKNVLDASLRSGVKRVLIPSTIGVFGPQTPKRKVPVETVTRPVTMYGITKIFCELLGEYYFRKYRLDVRGLRLPGIISYKSPPGGGTTDYSIEMIVSAVKGKSYTCFLRSDTRLPMMYIPDAIESIIKLSEADGGKLIHRTDFNVSAFDFTPGELETELRKYFSGFSVEYRPDERQKIAETWPSTLDCRAAVDEWGFSPRFDMSRMVEDMVRNLSDQSSPAGKR
ncbi:MAG: NAD-dependent epimerase/dehydratase family protein [Thermoplasmata archaeon]|uniref:NAD-dependent epimerase/dehydratase family protein n=1 Tax=Candidatus Sysuiplasma superficiale TaxID=2823368 RepID=A0A8J7YTN3_9ARCH|nr:NAD-dependent epimerase/dehydratase family protein [Candidatus Sysuiplasma superficiale]MBX8644287.1 NAD-dependent epimerase/dehydratase family protein [Candidatus Sysuiplasma superficiale]